MGIPGPKPSTGRLIGQRSSDPVVKQFATIGRKPRQGEVTRRPQPTKHGPEVVESHPSRTRRADIAQRHTVA